MNPKNSVPDQHLKCVEENHIRLEAETGRGTIICDPEHVLGSLGHITKPRKAGEKTMAYEVLLRVT